MRALRRTATSAASPTAPAASAGSGSILSSSLNPRLASEPVRFYGRRKGKPIKAGRQALLDELLPRLRLSLPSGSPAGSLAPATPFPFAPREVWLEVGFGSGEHLAAQAEAHPHIGFIGSEVFLNGVGSLVRHVAE